MNPQQIIDRFERIDRDEGLISLEEMHLYLQARQVILLETLIQKLTPFHERKKTISAEVPILNREVEELELSVRSTNALKYEGIKTVKDLIQMNKKDLLQVPHLGRKSLVEIQDVLHGYGLSLGMVIDGL